MDVHTPDREVGLQGGIGDAALPGCLDPGAGCLAEGDRHLPAPLRRLETAPSRQHRRDREHDKDDRLPDVTSWWLLRRVLSALLRRFLCGDIAPSAGSWRALLNDCARLTCVSMGETHT